MIQKKRSFQIIPIYSSSKEITCFLGYQHGNNGYSFHMHMFPALGNLFRLNFNQIILKLRQKLMAHSWYSTKYIGIGSEAKWNYNVCMFIVQSKAPFEFQILKKFGRYVQVQVQFSIASVLFTCQNLRFFSHGCSILSRMRHTSILGLALSAVRKIDKIEILFHFIRIL